MSATEHDISDTLKAKTDQINADDLKVSGPRTVEVVSVVVTTTEQPMTIKLTAGLPFRPCKTMRRLLAEAWGRDARQWKGRRMTIYTDPDISFGDQKRIGGIRISHLSDIDGPLTVNLTATKGRKQPWTVQPIAKSASAWTAGQDHAEWAADAGPFAAELAKLDLDVATLDQRLAEDAALRKWWNGSPCPALRCSWVPSQWRANLVAMLAKKKAATEKPAEPQQGD